MTSANSKDWWSKGSFLRQYAELQDWKGVPYRRTMLNALRLRPESFPLSGQEWKLLVEGNSKWRGSWDTSVTLESTGSSFSPPNIIRVSKRSKSPPLLMEEQKDEVLCSIHSINNMMQSRIVSPAMLEHLPNAFTADGRLQQCDSENVIRLCRIIGVSLARVDVIRFGFGGTESSNELAALKDNKITERFLQSAGAFLMVRQGRVGRGNAVGSGHYVAVLYGGNVLSKTYFRRKWILLNSLTDSARLYSTAYDAIRDYQRGMTVNISLLIPCSPALIDNDVQIGASALSDAHYKLLRLQLTSAFSLSVQAWIAVVASTQGVSIMALNNAYTPTVFPTLEASRSLTTLSLEDVATTADIGSLRNDWRAAYNDTLLAVLGSTNTLLFRQFVLTLLLSYALTAESEGQYAAYAALINTSTDAIYQKLLLLASSLFASLNSTGSISSMQPEGSERELKICLTIALQPLIEGSSVDDVMTELFDSLNTDSQSRHYFIRIRSMSYALSLYIPEHRVLNGLGVLGAQSELLLRQIPNSLAQQQPEQADSDVEVAESVRQYYASTRQQQLKATVLRLLLQLLYRDNASALINGARGNLLQRPKAFADITELSVSAVPAAIPFHILADTMNSGLDSFPL